VDTAALLQRTRDHLGASGNVFWTADNIVTNGLNLAQRLLVLVNPGLLVQRTLVVVAGDTPLLDLRAVAPTMLSLQRVALGDLTQTPPVPAYGQVGDLRKTTLQSLRTQRFWWQQRAPVPTHWFAHGLHLVGLWPRVREDAVVPMGLPLTLIGSTVPTPLSASALTQVPDLAAPWHPLLADVAAAVMALAEGAGTCEMAVQQLALLLGLEPQVAPLMKALRALSYRRQAQSPLAQQGATP
jgi:hypothetical protein